MEGRGRRGRRGRQRWEDCVKRDLAGVENEGCGGRGVEMGGGDGSEVESVTEVPVVPTQKYVKSEEHLSVFPWCSSVVSVDTRQLSPPGWFNSNEFPVTH